MSRGLNSEKVYTASGTWLVRATFEDDGTFAVLLSHRTLHTGFTLVERSAFDSPIAASNRYQRLIDSHNARTEAAHSRKVNA